ncbi:TrbI/VirB10 family protein [Sphingomonas abietis]|uniref:Type VI secretion protein n=1 Tax=Sphingomonas abietis TaxID=3012344 RepID=A0ABY7NQH3_9SPHN|nr:TrbI/VirB10 family protein [Sphingomonas abietis]WBO23787.1 type VI secretion protein [Sphingomonas abietis]
MTPTREPILLRPIMDVDPRTQADPQALVLASRNAYPLVAQAGRRSDSAGLAIGGAVALLLGGGTFWMMSQHRAPAPIAAPLPVSPPAVSPVTAAPPALPVPLPVATRPISIAQVEAAAAPAMVFDGSTAPATETATTAPPAPGKSGVATVPAVTGDNDQFALRVGGSEDVVSAEKLSDPANTVTQGTLIPAVLETAIDTDLPGYVRAVVSRDVRSFDGTHILIPRSTRLIGQYKSGLAAGQTRAYVIWTRLIRPDGVSVALGSPAVDFSGTSGLTGKVDSHFLKRFGAAALLTVIGGLSAIGNNSVVLSSGQNAGAVAAQGNGQIPPTVHVPQGQPIRVFTARDLDFSTVAQAG